MPASERLGPRLRHDLRRKLEDSRRSELELRGDELQVIAFSISGRP